VNLLLCSESRIIFERCDKTPSGRLPLRKLVFTFSSVNFVNFASCAGRVPSNAFPLTSSTVNSEKLPSASGRLPLSRFLLTFMCFNFVSCAAGKVPSNAFPLTSSAANSEKLLNPSGNSPFKPALFNLLQGRGELVYSILVQSFHLCVSRLTFQ
jgi:hypothetical protein